jgi:hypothetical protein
MPLVAECPEGPPHPRCAEDPRLVVQHHLLTMHTTLLVKVHQGRMHYIPLAKQAQLMPQGADHGRQRLMSTLDRALSCSNTSSAAPQSHLAVVGDAQGVGCSSERRL